MATTLIPFRRSSSAGRPHRNMVLDVGDDTRLLRTPGAKLALVGLVAAYIWIPLNYSSSTLLTLAFCGMYAIGAIGLNLLIGYTGQVSLGHAAFFGVGAYSAFYLGAEHGWPFPLYLAAAIVIGAGLGVVIGPFALRLRGNYLAVVTIGLVFFAEHVFKNWDSVTGGTTGAEIRPASVNVGPLDFKALELGNETYSREQSAFWLIWGLVAVCALVAKNIVRSRPGRAMQAVRDRDVSAEVIGVQLTSYKLGAFAVSSGMAAAAGCMYGVLQGYVNATEFGGPQGLFLSITFVAMIIIGGVGTVMGGILGALLVNGGQRFISENGDLAILAPIISEQPGEAGIMSTGEFNGILFGLFIVVFLMFEPRGLVALWQRVKTYFATWPFSY